MSSNKCFKKLRINRNLSGNNHRFPCLQNLTSSSWGHYWLLKPSSLAVHDILLWKAGTRVAQLETKHNRIPEPKVWEFRKLCSTEFKVQWLSLIVYVRLLIDWSWSCINYFRTWVIFISGLNRKMEAILSSWISDCSFRLQVSELIGHLGGPFVIVNMKYFLLCLIWKPWILSSWLFNTWFPL